MVRSQAQDRRRKATPSLLVCGTKKKIRKKWEHYLFFVFTTEEGAALLLPRYVSPKTHERPRASMEEDMGHSGAGAKGAGEGERVEAGGGRRLAPVTGQTLRDHFHLPLHTVAQRFGMCTTAFKKMCRRLGIAKWPHRQVPPARGSPPTARSRLARARARAPARVPRVPWARRVAPPVRRGISLRRAHTAR